MIRVLVVDDSLSIRKKICEIIDRDPELTVAGEAENGKAAFELVKSVSPDAIILDLVMPVMDGQEATELIMAYHPTPIIIHSSAANRGEDYKTIDALSAGALDSVEKTMEDWEQELPLRVKRAAGIKVVTHLKRKGIKKLQSDSVWDTAIGPGRYNLLVMGASTGGPRVVLDIICQLPRDFPIPIIVVIHVADSLQNTLGDWLKNNSNLDVVVPADGQTFKGRRGTVYLAPPGRHLIVENGDLRLTATPLVNFCRPSIDVLFRSVANDQQLTTIGVLLTGMGNDGAAGLKAIKDSGGYTIAQDEETSMVFGMPKEAIELGAASTVLPVSEIPGEIIKLAGIGL
ncbi:MAG: chemotaxis-specific protein-glutamate methyltransferase CheB [Thermodesulfobacteriota bacterium]|nr:chemotaxis-specific protein-glutamate methyltransferase CheB [Thermodesulfobacteriota bacterium]